MVIWLVLNHCCILFYRMIMSLFIYPPGMKLQVVSSPLSITNNSSMNVIVSLCMPKEDFVSSIQEQKYWLQSLYILIHLQIILQMGSIILQHHVFKIFLFNKRVTVNCRCDLLITSNHAPSSMSLVLIQETAIFAKETLSPILLKQHT